MTSSDGGRRVAHTSESNAGGFGFAPGAPESAIYVNFIRADAGNREKSKGGDIDADE